jgi:glycosyltransferase involved in cell wall biosynthesis/2-polyprenyl-3-methyl-5-hydroxy-6-metoxy-1,4-benzoquinol methylase
MQGIGHAARLSKREGSDHYMNRRTLSFCPVCDSQRLYYAFSHGGFRLVRCADCNLFLLNPQPSDAELAAIYNESYFLGEDTSESREQVAQMKCETARIYLQQIRRYCNKQSGRLLEIGCGKGELLFEAQRLGYEVTGVEISESAVREARARVGEQRVHCGELDMASLDTASFDVCVLSDVLEHVRDPLSFLGAIRKPLRPDGVLFVATPSIDSWSARFLQQKWMEFKPEHLTYFDRATLQNALQRAGYHQIIIQPGWKVLNLGYIANHFRKYPVPAITPLVDTAVRFLPHKLRERNLSVVASGMVALARARELPQQRTVSVVLPAYNEAATFGTLMELLVQKRLPALDMELVVVESNSTDGTREIAQRYSNHPKVRLVLEDQPRGKGHAVRTGLQHATGDFILIQDADLEYDLEDYEALLEPLVQNRAAFVLGSRHGGSAWKMRQFADQRVLSSFLNLGHWFFTTLVNVLFAQRLKDPFTMYKVFRRDCLYGLRFECNRFDFDYELLIKLILKGYRPLEIPVNYRSRSFKEGKKVSILRDPITWLLALARLRLRKIDPLSVVECDNRLREASFSSSSAAGDDREN